MPLLLLTACHAKILSGTKKDRPKPVFEIRYLKSVSDQVNEILSPSLSVTIAFFQSAVLPACLVR